jgi:hypothetical protein
MNFIMDGWKERYYRGVRYLKIRYSPDADVMVFELKEAPQFKKKILV